MKRKMSDDGLDLLKELEGFRADVYLDTAKKPTIGYGHLILPLEKFDAPLSQEKATELLRHDVAIAEDAVNRLVKVRLEKNQFDALVCFVFNIGGGKDGFAGSTMLKYLNSGKFDFAANEFHRWNKRRDAKGNLVEDNGLKNRREKEHELFTRLPWID